MATAPKPRIVRSQPAVQRAQFSPRPTRTDPSSPEYRRAARKYTQLMVAMPILLVTSWFLFDRLVLGNEAKTLPKNKSRELAETEKNKG
ncbi:hypothetical protein F4819DRAFT_462005 [Hypoxylon fuscum]|nr:hypothetical protein F4819DRAFT_462005 [Hypoxylon fuscum]